MMNPAELWIWAKSRHVEHPAAPVPIMRGLAGPELRAGVLKAARFSAISVNK